MPRPRGRETRKKVGQILAGSLREPAMTELSRIPDEQLTGHLFFYLYDPQERIKFRSASAMGQLAVRTAARNMERARIILRRIMWNLNDESGGIGWGSPEAMGEILALCPDLAAEFESILFSYLDPDGNFIEHETLQRGVLWGIGTYLAFRPDRINPRTRSLLHTHLNGPDAVRRAYALRALAHARSLSHTRIPADVLQDHRRVDLFNGWELICAKISDMAGGWENPDMPTRRCDINIARTMNLAQEMIALARQGDEQREDPGCGVLYGILLDSGYRILDLARKEKNKHMEKGWWAPSKAWEIKTQ